MLRWLPDTVVHAKVQVEKQVIDTETIMEDAARATADQPEQATMNKQTAPPPKPSPKPSLKSLEAAAINRLVEMNKGQKVQPSQEAVLIAARMMALKAHRQG
jgi:hypothetical protein